MAQDAPLLADRVVLITGAGRGLGRAYAVDAAAHGAIVLVNDIDEAAAESVVNQVRSAGGRATVAAGSIADWAVCEQLVARGVSEHGRLDGLVNNAGLFYVRPPWEEDEARIRRLIEVNVLGTLFCADAALRQMVRQRDGSIVNVTSGAHAGMPGMSTYGASKGAVASYTYAAAIDAMPHNVRINAISPIATTRMGIAARDGRVSDEVEVEPTVGPGEPGVPPENVAPLVTFLLSGLSRGITGQVIRLQGRQLSLVEHPVPLEPVRSEGGWTPQSIAEAFAGNLGSSLRPVGMGATRYEWHGPGG